MQRIEYNRVFKPSVGLGALALQDFATLSRWLYRVNESDPGGEDGANPYHAACYAAYHDNAIRRMLFQMVGWQIYRATTIEEVCFACRSLCFADMSDAQLRNYGKLAMAALRMGVGAEVGAEWRFIAALENLEDGYKVTTFRNERSSEEALRASTIARLGAYFSLYLICLHRLERISTLLHPFADRDGIVGDVYERDCYRKSYEIQNWKEMMLMNGYFRKPHEDIGKCDINQ